MKQCTKCGETKPIDDFYKAAGTRDGHRGECKACNAAAKKAWYLANRDAVKEKVRRWQRENAEHHNAQQRRRRQDPARKRAQRSGYLRRKYGISIEEYDELLAAQGGVCKICGRDPRADISLHVDHDHATGAIRSLLCFPCNVAIGLIREDPAHLTGILAYLDAHDPARAEIAELTRRRVAAIPPPTWQQSA